MENNNTFNTKTYGISDSSTLGSIGDFPNYSQYCLYRLPCGICTRTNSVCPLSGNSTITPSWQPNIVYTDGGGTVPADQIVKGETTTHLMC